MTMNYNEYREYLKNKTLEEQQIRNETPKNETITIYFGERHIDTLNEFDTLKRRLRRSRTGTLDFLLNYYHQSEKRRIEPIIS